MKIRIKNLKEIVKKLTEKEAKNKYKIIKIIKKLSELVIMCQDVYNIYEYFL